MMVLYSPDWTNTGFSFILLTVNPFRHSTLTEHGLYRRIDNANISPIFSEDKINKHIYCSFAISWLKETVRWILPLHQYR